jgi:acetyl esterase/lipase
MMKTSPLKAVGLAVSFALSPTAPAYAASEQAITERTAIDRSSSAARLHLKVTDKLRALIEHPAFRGFARQLLPWDNRDYDADLPLNTIETLLPYHSCVEPSIVVAGLNRLIDDAHSGKQVFYHIYTEEQKQQVPEKANTGLFFYRGKPGAPFAIIAPGGGFIYVGSVHEGFPYAAELSQSGLNAFVLRYRVGAGGRVASEDMAAAISYVFRHAAELQVGTDDYSVWGSSAGARMAAFIGSHGVAAFGGDDLPKPAAVITAYTAHSDHSDNEPPTFAVVGEDDEISPPSSMQGRIAALRQLGVMVEFRIYPKVGHGFGSGVGTTAEGWIDEARAFWVRAAHTERK